MRRRALLAALPAAVVGTAGCNGRTGPEPSTGTDGTQSTDGTPATAATRSPSTETGTSESTVVENGEGRLRDYVGNTDYFETTDERPIRGERSVRARGVEHGSYRTVVSLSGLPAYPRPGDTLRVEIRVETENTYAGLLFGVQSGKSPWPGYRLRVDTGASPGVELEKITGTVAAHENPERNKLSYAEVEPDPGTTYTVELEWGRDGAMPYTVADSEGNALAADPDPNPDREYRDGGVGFMASSSWTDQERNVATFDDIVVTRSSGNDAG